MNRADGYYWVIEPESGIWEVMKWGGGVFTADGVDFEAENMEEIDEQRILDPDERTTYEN